MGWIGGMMQLVMGGTLQDSAGDAGEGDPHVAVAQMTISEEERHRENVAVQKRERAHAGAESVGHGAEYDAGRKTDQVHEGDDLDRMLAQFGQGRHHLCGMVNLVELPQSRNLMETIMSEPI